MKTKTVTEQAAVHEAVTALLEHLERAKLAKFRAVHPVAGLDYLKERDRLFAGETVASLTRKIWAMEKRERRRRESIY